jgi:hypothetical protein
VTNETLEEMNRTLPRVSDGISICMYDVHFLCVLFVPDGDESKEIFITNLLLSFTYFTGTGCGRALCSCRTLMASAVVLFWENYILCAAIVTSDAEQMAQIDLYTVLTGSKKM